MAIYGGINVETMQYIQYEPADIEIYLRNQGIVLKEKSLIAFNKVSGKVIAAGTEAERIGQAETENTLVVSPLRQGVVVDFILMSKLFGILLEKVFKKKMLLKPSIIICVPKDIGEVAKTAYKESLLQSACAREAMIAEQPLAQVVDQMPDKNWKKYQIIIGITKYEPEKYLIEQFRYALNYAKQEGILAERTAELFEEAKQQLHDRE